MITRRNFLKRSSVVLVALGAGIRSSRQALDVAQGSVMPDGVDVDTAHVELAQALAKVEDDAWMNMPESDAVVVDIKEPYSLFDSSNSDPIIAARLIQALDPKDFDSLAQYSGCISDIANEFGL